MITKRFEIRNALGKVAYGRTMSYTDDSRLGDALKWFYELAEAHNIDTSNPDNTLVIYNR